MTAQEQMKFMKDLTMLPNVGQYYNMLGAPPPVTVTHLRLPRRRPLPLVLRNALTRRWRRQAP
jgi:hypothetical protein